MIEAKKSASNPSACESGSQVSDVESQVKGRHATIERVISSAYLHCAILLLIVAYCFGRTLSSYFLADDFGEISYVSRIFNGESHLFWSNFVGNYMQIPGMNVYRPWLLVSLVIDFLIYKANATGFYFTNLSYFSGVVLLIYFIARQLSIGWTRVRSAVAAFFGAASFAANPLRCESVSWVVGRVDIICCFFYLASYLSFLKSRRSDDGQSSRIKKIAYNVLGVVAFFLAMGTKEMAIGLPVLLALTAFFNIGLPSRSFNLTQRVRDAAIFSAPLWVSAAIYFVIRFTCLGTLGGGYVAGFGASQLSFMVQRWLDLDTIKRLFFPFSRSLFEGQTVYSEFLTICYGALAAVTLIRAAENKLSIKWFLFLSGWLISAAVPIFQLWGLGYDLEGSRFYFFLSIPLCLMAPLMLFRPTSKVRTTSELKLLVTTAVILTATTWCLGRVAQQTDLEWVHAGKENRQVSLAAQKLVQSENALLLPVLGIPKERNGAHQILNGSTFATMLSPPFTTVDLSNRFATFDPIMFGPPQYIDASRFKSVLRRSLGKFFVWNKESASFKQHQLDLDVDSVGVVDLPPTSSNSGWLPHAHGHATYGINDGTVEMRDLRDGDSIRVDGLNINPVAADFLQFDYRASDVPEGASFVVYSDGASADERTSEAQAEATMTATSSFKTVRIRLSRFWRWYCNGNIKALSLQPYPCKKVSMRNFKVVSANTVCPTLSMKNVTPDGAGIYRVEPPIVDLTVSANGANDSSGVDVEIGKVNYFFNNFEKVAGASPVAATVEAMKPMNSSGQSDVHIDAKYFSAPGFYEIRARSHDADGKPIGEYSDTITLRVGAAHK